MRTALHIAGMFVLGATTLVLAGIGHAWRLSRPVPHVRGEMAAVGTSGTPGAVAAVGSQSPPFSTPFSGIHADLQWFLSTIDSDRPAAVSALDGADRVSRVMAYASRDAAGPQAIARAIAGARRALQNGDVSASTRAALRAAGMAGLPLPLTLRPPDDPSRFVGGTLLSPEGTRLGTIRSVDSDQLVVERGGLRHILGFLTLEPGTLQTYAGGPFVFGSPDAAEPMMVLAYDTAR